MNNRRKIDVNPLNSIGSIIIMVLVLFALYMLAKGIFTILYWATPLMVIAALFINHQVVVDYVKMLFNFLKTNPLVGIAGIILSIFLFPVVAAFLLGKALLYRKLGQVSEELRKRTEGQFTEYEEIKDEPAESKLDLPDLETQRQKPKVKIEQKSNRPKSQNEDFSDYEELFD